MKSTSLGAKQGFHRVMLLLEDQKGNAFLASSSFWWMLASRDLWPEGSNLIAVFFALIKTLIALHFSIFSHLSSPPQAPVTFISPWQHSTSPAMYTVPPGVSTVFTWH